MQTIGVVCSTQSHWSSFVSNLETKNEVIKDKYVIVDNVCYVKVMSVDHVRGVLLDDVQFRGNVDPLLKEYASARVRPKQQASP